MLHIVITTLSPDVRGLVAYGMAERAEGTPAAHPTSILLLHKMPSDTISVLAFMTIADMSQKIEPDSGGNILQS